MFRLLSAIPKTIYGNTSIRPSWTIAQRHVGRDRPPYCSSMIGAKSHGLPCSSNGSSENVGQEYSGLQRNVARNRRRVVVQSEREGRRRGCLVMAQFPPDVDDAQFVMFRPHARRLERDAQSLCN